MENETKLHLKETDKGLSLTDGRLSLMADFSVLTERILPHKIGGEMLIKAAKPPKQLEVSDIVSKENQGLPLAIDATAGLGEDSFLLATAGYQVLMIEKNPVIFALLRDAIDRGLRDKDLAPIISRMHLFEGDSVKILSQREIGVYLSASSNFVAMPEPTNKPVPLVNLVYLDPMFPGRTKSGLIKKKFQLLQQLEAPEENPEELFMAAKSINPGKIIVKRPAKEAPITNTIKPTYVIPGKVIRYDCYYFPN